MINYSLSVKSPVSGFWTGQSALPSQYFVLGCWLSLHVILCYLAGQSRLPHGTHTCVLTAAWQTQPYIISFWPMEYIKWTAVLCDSHVSFFRVYLACVTIGMSAPKATAMERACQTLIPCGSVSCCHWVSVIELIIPYFHHLSICNLQWKWLQCSEEWDSFGEFMWWDEN